jgi:hypothetical protein
MINSHKEFVAEIKVFADKMELVNDFKYIRDLSMLSREIENTSHRTLIIGIDSINFSSEDYNSLVTYKYMIADNCQYNEDAIITSETENMFILSSLKDYLNYISDVDTVILDSDFETSSNNESTYVTISGSFTMLMKRSPSYWKKMEEYSESV